MLILDWSQISISNIVASLYRDRNALVGEQGVSLIRHTIFNALLSYKKQHQKKYGETVIVCDDRDYWRRDVMSSYKQNRKKSREKSDLDWGFIFETCNTIKQELIENFPYKVLQVPHAEADDLMYCLAKACAEDERFVARDGLFESKQPVLIVSNDGDMHQTMLFDNVDVWEPRNRAFVKRASVADIEMMIQHHICSGDTADGIPNIRSEANCIVEGVRQQAVRKTFAEEVIRDLPLQPKNIQENYKRNQQLVDFRFIPQHIYDETIRQYVELKPQGNRGKVTHYLMNRQMIQLFDRVNEF